VRFGSSANAINPAPIMGYGPGSWVYGRLAKAPDIPALAVGQLWLDPSTLTREAVVKQ
jgi:O-antigen ligase